VSKSGRAPKNDPALFALAMAAGLGDAKTKQAALDALPVVARIGTHLFHFVRYVEAFRGWGRGLREAVSNWYLGRDVDSLAYQVVKYQSRDGWSHRDVLRLAHPKTSKRKQNAVLRWAVKGEVMKSAPELIHAFEEAKTADEKRTIELIGEYGLTREMVMTQHLKSKAVWEALLDNMPMHALIRNLGNLSKNGLLVPGAWDVIEQVTTQITDAKALEYARVHPVALLVASKTYGQGHGMRGRGTWEVVGDVVDALETAFYMAFDAIHPTNKRYVLGVDVSGSMGAQILNMPLTAAEGAAVMAMTTYRTESKAAVIGFAGGTRTGAWQFAPGGTEMRDLKLTRKDTLNTVLRKTREMNFGRTDCALPMLWAMERNIEADVFVIYTDNETWCGKIHPVQALDQYRQKTGIPAKLAVVAMTSSGFSIADPDDAGMLDVVGFDTAAPSVINKFAAGDF
jgi:60 kDa SS-A/Ro ribonucleoprotein